MLAPADTPADALKRLAEAYRSAVRSPAVRGRIEALGYEPIEDAPGQFAVALREDIAAIRSNVASASTVAPR